METIKRSKGVVYRDRVTLTSGKIESKTFSRKADLVSWKKNLQSEVAKHRALGIRPIQEISLDQLFDKWFENIVQPMRSVKTAAEYQVIYKKHFSESLGSSNIHQIRRSDIESLQSSLSKKGLQPKSTNKIMGVLKTLLNFAVRMDYLHASPMNGLASLKAPQRRLEYLSEAEISQVLNHARFKPYYPVIVTAINTGMRIGEILGLCWDSIRWDSESIEVSRSLSRYKLNERTKTSLIRHIPMNDTMKALLKDQFKNQKNPKFVFTDESGQPFRSDHFCKRIFHPLLEEAGVKKIRFHDLRHTFASQFMMKGGNIYDLQKILGHTSVVMTQVYAHLSPQHLKKAIQIVNFSADEKILPHSCHEQSSVEKNFEVLRIKSGV